MSVNSSAQMATSISEVVSSNGLEATSVTPIKLTSATIGTGIDNSITTLFSFSESLVTQSSSRPQIYTLFTGNCSNQPQSSPNGCWGLTGSAPTATALSGIWPTNNNSWTINSLVPETQILPPMFTGKASVRRVSWGGASAALIVCCMARALLK